MKKLLVLLLIALFVIGAVTISFAVNPAGPGYAGDTMGMATGRYVSDPQRTFRLVRNGPNGNTVLTSAALTAGNLVIWDTSIYAADGVSVCKSAVTGDSKVAGIVITAMTTEDGTTTSIYGAHGVSTATEDVGKANWGWLQTYGKSAVRATAVAAATSSRGSLSSGDAVCIGSVGGQIVTFWGSTTAANVQGNAGFALEDNANSTGYIFLKCE